MNETWFYLWLVTIIYARYYRLATQAVIVQQLIKLEQAPTSFLQTNVLIIERIKLANVNPYERHGLIILGISQINLYLKYYLVIYDMMRH